MRINPFVTGIMAGMAAGAAVSMAAEKSKMPKTKKMVKKSAGRTLHMAGDIVDNITRMM